MGMVLAIFVAALVSGFVGIVGVIYGFQTARRMREEGEERVFISKWKIHYKGRVEGGSPIDVSPRQAEFIQFFFTVDIFNTRDHATGFRNVQIEFVSGGQIRLAVTPADASTLKVEAMREDISEVEVINLYPRQWAHWNFRRNVWGPDVENVVNAEQVYLAFTDPDGNRHRHLIADMPRHALTF
jgi:hypothetical protein